ncbi:hypothetical protein FA10DRAFT_264427 [Acaromyces ingoldii]|uniref:Mid2 domain-containing protein n=1 Tax=Acaromyces ingoldii TaxID=215250 RepID=A0A316Z0I9_9BASI|nr:hypothetical protein FA10DRAFT_264427 [Acaromyces ingoldii]PWN93833.1 hypothetical protein FA10DRAFT_264427 [Acaromyces ingoldii]
MKSTLLFTSIPLLLLALAQALIIDDNYTNCIKLSFFVVPTPAELASSDGVVATLSYNASLDAPTLYNGSYLWRDAAPGNSGLDVGVTFFNQSGEYWIQDGGVERQFNTSAWYTNDPSKDRTYLFVYLFNQTGTVANSNVQPSQQTPLINSKGIYCDQYWTADGKRLTPSYSSPSPGHSGLSGGAKLGVVLGCVLGAFLLFFALVLFLVCRKKRTRSQRCQEAYPSALGNETEPKYSSTSTPAGAGAGAPGSYEAGPSSMPAGPSDQREGLPSYFLSALGARKNQGAQRPTAAPEPTVTSQPTTVASPPTTATSPPNVTNPTTEAPPAYTS